MKSRIKWIIGILALGIWLSGTGWMHKFYVSLTEIRYNEKSDRLEVSMRIFPDDFDRALSERYGVDTHLASSLEPSVADSLVGEYLKRHFKLLSDGREITFSYLGKEPEADAIWCFLESERLNAVPSQLRIENNILMERFEDQVNIIQVYAGAWNKGLLFTKQSPEGSLRIGE
ncbi:MAG: DUF6702 family protein [Bacteroidales bacterium]